MSERNQSSRLRDPVIVTLRDRVLDRVGDALTGPSEQIAQTRAPSVGRHVCSRKRSLAPEAGKRANGCLLSAAPLNPAERRIAIHERLDARPKRLGVSLVARYGVSENEIEHPGKTRRFPNVFDVAECRVEREKSAELPPWLRGIARAEQWVD